MSVGMIGLGAMGHPMALRLKGGHEPVIGYDLRPEVVTAAVADGIAAGESVRAVAEAAPLVLSMITDDAALEAVVFGPRGLLDGPAFEGCFVDFSTTSVALARRVGSAVAEAGGTFLDAAVIGGSVPAAREGRSPIVIAGDETVFRRWEPLLGRLGTLDFVGGPGTAKAVKIANNLLVGVLTASNAEALSLGEQAGVDLAALVGWIGGGSGGSRVLDTYMGNYVRDGHYGRGLIGLSLMAKDLRLACELAADTDTPLHLGEYARQLYLEAARVLGPDEVFPAVLDHYRHQRRQHLSRGQGGDT